MLALCIQWQPNQFRCFCFTKQQLTERKNKVLYSIRCWCAFVIICFDVKRQNRICAFAFHVRAWASYGSSHMMVWMWRVYTTKRRENYGRQRGAHVRQCMTFYTFYMWMTAYTIQSFLLAFCCSCYCFDDKAVVPSNFRQFAIIYWWLFELRCFNMAYFVECWTLYFWREKGKRFLLRNVLLLNFITKNYVPHCSFCYKKVPWNIFVLVIK